MTSVMAIRGTAAKNGIIAPDKSRSISSTARNTSGKKFTPVTSAQGRAYCFEKVYDVSEL